MATTKNLCAQIPIDLHERVSEERERLGKTTSEYIVNLIQDYYNMMENQKGGIQMTEKGRTMAFQIPEELFQRIKRHLERETLRSGKKLTQRDFVLNLITQALDEADAAALRGFLRENGFGTLVAHAPYTLNACGKEEAVRDFAHRAMEEDIARLEAALPGQYYNFHPGSHVGQGAAEGVRLIAAQLNAILTPGMTTTVLLETMAGKGSEVGRTFEELAAILDKVRLNEKVAVCLDTCHVWDGGYDIVRDLDGVLAQFDRVIGLEKLKALHVNDSLNPCGAHKDRHAQIGEGHIGAAAFARIAQHPVLAGLPKILETPNDDAGWAREIAFFKAAAAGGTPQKPHGQAEG